jgi:hypothetical protein
MATTRSAPKQQVDAAAWLDSLPSPSTPPAAKPEPLPSPRQPATAPPGDEPEPAPLSWQYTPRNPDDLDWSSNDLRDAEAGRVFQIATDVDKGQVGPLLERYANTGATFAREGVGTNAIVLLVSRNLNLIQVEITKPGFGTTREKVTATSIADPAAIDWLAGIATDIRQTPITAHTPMLVVIEPEALAPDALEGHKQRTALESLLNVWGALHGAVVTVIVNYPGLKPALQLIPLNAEPSP